MAIEKLKDIADVTAGTSPKGELINSHGIGLPFFQGSKEFGEIVPRPERFTEHPVRTASKGDVLVGVRAPVGKVNLSPFACAIGRGVMAVTPKNQSDGKFLFYFLRYLEGKWDSLGSTGSIFENLSASVLRSVEIPEILDRAMVGEVLYNLDLKIENNKSLARTLESTAKTIFKSWFIDFDPVKAKMAGEAPVGMDAEIAALFPDSMVDSQLGGIPSGWELRSLAEVVSVTKGRSYKSSELEESSVSLVTLKSFLRGGGYRKDGLKPFAGTFKDDQVVKPGELVMAFTDVTQAAELIGVPAIVEADPTAELLVASLDVGIVRPLASSVPNLFIYFHLKSDSFREHAKSHASGTTVLHLSKDAVPNFNLAMPPAELLQKFREIAEPAFSLMDSLSQQSRLLSETRDSLLPRLISGELEIPDEILAA